MNDQDPRAREGLVRYRPISGEEWRAFRVQCRDCRHCSKPDGYDTCAFGILDRIFDSGNAADDSALCWHDPENLRVRGDDGREIYPAQCLRFTPRDEQGGERRDPTPKDCDGQMFLGELLTATEKTAAERVKVKV